MATTIWLAIDIAAEGPDAVIIIDRMMNDETGIESWRIVNPASEIEQAEFTRVGKELADAFTSTEVDGQMELPFEEGTDEPS